MLAKVKTFTSSQTTENDITIMLHHPIYLPIINVTVTVYRDCDYIMKQITVFSMMASPKLFPS